MVTPYAGQAGGKWPRRSSVRPPRSRAGATFESRHLDSLGAFSDGAAGRESYPAAGRQWPGQRYGSN